MSYRYIMTRINSDGTFDLCGTNNRIPLQDITTLGGAVNRIKLYNLNRRKSFKITDTQTNEEYYYYL